MNVWANHDLSLSKGRQGSAAPRLVHAAFEGTCLWGPIQPIVSHVKLNTLQAVLNKVGLSDAMAEAARNAIEASRIGGVLGQSSYAVFGGGVQPVRDAKDLGVLETAIAGSADLLVTHTIQDCMPGPRADIDARVVSGDVLLVRFGKSRFGLVIASVLVVKAWLPDGALSPAGLLECFLPSVAARPSFTEN